MNVLSFLKTQNAASCLIALIAALSGWATYEQIAVGITYVTIPIFFCFIIFLFHLLTGQLNKSFNRGDVYLFIIFLIALSSFTWTLSEEVWFNQIFWQILCIIIYLCTKLFIKSKNQIKIVVIAALIGLLISGYLVQDVTNEWGITADRQSVDGVNNNFVSYIIAGTIYIAFIAYNAGIFGKNFLLLLLPIFIYSYFKIDQLGTRGAGVSMALLFLWFLLSKFFSKKIVSILSLTSFIVAALVSFGLIENLLLLLDMQSVRSTGDLSGRTTTWAIAREFISNNLFFGIGTGAFRNVNFYEIGAHNVFLTLLLDVGLIGLIAFLFFIWHIFKPAFRAHDNNSWKIVGFFLAFWMPIALSGHWELAPFSWLILGLTHIIIRIKI